jgi:exo-beta-1,3-glucanase (GH17 family)
MKINIKELLLISLYLFSYFSLILSEGCKKIETNPPITPPTTVTPTKPVLTTTDVTAITHNAAVSGGTISSNGGAIIIKRGVYWDTIKNPSLKNFLTTDSTGTGTFISYLTNLLPNKTYYLKAYAINSNKDTGYGQEVVFTTKADCATLITIPANFIMANNASSGGIISQDGGASIIDRGLCWSTVQHPKVTDSRTNDGNGIGSFTSHITNLSKKTTYYYRSFAINSNKDTCYGNELMLLTPEIPAYRLPGLCFSPYFDGESPDWGSQISEQRIVNLLQIIAPYLYLIRTYGTKDGLQKIGVNAHRFNLKVAAGAWLSKNMTENEQQIAELIAMGLKGEIDVAIVGSEVLLRNDLTKAQLIAYINRVKAALPNIPVTTAEVYQNYLSNPDLVSAVDVIYAHFYPYWEGININCAVNFIDITYKKVQQIAQGKEVVVAETGWPSAGNPVGNAVPSLTNASNYFLNFSSWARAKQVKYFYFEAFDEIWKQAHEGLQGGYFGLWGKNGGPLKPGMHKVFDGETAPNNWQLDTAAILSTPPSISFTVLPPIGSLLNLEGIVKGVLPSEYKVAVYIYVNGWWNKPTFAEPLTRLACDGTFICNITTGGNSDAQATRIKAFLVPSAYSPPLLSGQATIPASIDQNAVASIEVLR